MTSVLARARRLIGQDGGVTAQVEGLQRAVDAARPYLDDPALDHATLVVERAGERLRLSGEHTVVALAGATGSGKSSTFNAVTGLDLAAVGVRRPTTSWTNACVWGTEGADPLLDWLGIPQRHRISRDSTLDLGSDEPGPLHGLVLLDLPDHDSTEVSHHLEVDRLVQLTDMLVWVMDPQKYADAVVHDRYLKPLASHADVMLVVLNHIDEVAPDRRPVMVDDLVRLLRDDGLEEVPVLPLSATAGLGLEALHDELARRVKAKSAVRSRLMADVLGAAEGLASITGSAPPPSLSRHRRAELTDALAEAAGVPVVVDAVRGAARARARRATGWPVTAWLGRLRPDPLRRLHLDLGSSGRDLVGRARTSTPTATPVQRARVDSVVRGVADEESAGLTPPWAGAVRQASVARLPDIEDALDQALGAADLGKAEAPAWTRAVRAVQWTLLLAALVGGVWLAGLALLGYLQVAGPSAPEARGLPVPTVLLVGGALLGVLLAVLCRGLVGLSARGRARSVDRQLREAVGRVAAELVLQPVESVLVAYREVREGLTVALR